MDNTSRTTWVRPVAIVSLLALFGSPALIAQRQLSWDALDVTARLGDNGVLDVTELQTMVFTGDWNGGERTFSLRPRQTLEFVGMERIDPSTNERVPLTQDGSLDDVDEYSFTDSRTLRWRSRLPSSPPFTRARITYVIHYQLFGILLKEDDRYLLDHDFAFPDRVGDIARFSLRLALDSTWEPLTALQESYSAGPLAPGRGFVLTVPMRYTGAGAPSANDTRRPGEVVAAVAAILGMCALSIGALLLREHSLGRFVPVRADRVDADWLRRNILVHPAEVVGAAWDRDVDKDEVASLISRLVSEGKLTSQLEPGASGNLALQLRVDRESLQGYERTLVDGLFFDGRASTSTDDVKAHYVSKGYDPAKTIASELNARVKQLLPKGDDPSVWWWPSVVLFVAGLVCLASTFSRDDPGVNPFAVLIAAMILAGVGQIPGVVFRQRIDWGIKALLLSLVVPVLTALSVSALLWYRVGTGAMEWSSWTIGAVTAFTLWIVYSAVNGLKSRNHREAIAFRKMLATGRMYFTQELQKERPALRDEWYPWIAAFGLTNEVAQWTVQHAPERGSSSPWRSTTVDGSSSGEFSSSGPAWTGAAGGRSGGAGGGAAWAAAVGGMAAGVSPPSSSSSSGGGSSGSSSSGSSGGGGGGGW